MQFNKDEAGVLHPLPQPCVDTGMGLERLAAVLQHVHSNYDIDLFQTLIRAAARETGCANLHDNSLKVIADHVRACSFLIVDGVIPGSAGRGYVLRRIMRRALRHGYKLGQTRPFLHRLVHDLVLEMGDAYPELKDATSRVQSVIQAEEEQFGRTLEHGMKILDTVLTAGDTLDGETIFTLYDTYGFPVDLTADIARERQKQADMAGFERAMQRQREQARAAGKFKMAANVDYQGVKTAFHGYDTLELDARITALYVGGTAVEKVLEGQDAVVVLDTTPFYAESGGQVGDVGELLSVTGQFKVEDTQKIQAEVFGHVGTVQQGSLVQGERVRARVNLLARRRAAANHSATHLLHAALRTVLGPHVQQKGSLVDPEKTRFDFAHDKPLTEQEIALVEKLVNDEIRENHEVTARHMRYDDAIKAGAMALFGEKYGDEVRVLGMGDFSTELCGGTHVGRTGDIGFFKITAETGVAAGVRRVEGTTAEGALAYVQQIEASVQTAAALLKTPTAELTQRLGQLTDHVKSLEKELARLKSKLAATQGEALLAQALEIKGIKVLAATLDAADVPTLRETMDRLKDKLKTAAIVLASVEAGKVSLIAGVTSDVIGKLKAGELVNHVAQQVGGKGGGRSDLAQAGGTNPQALPQALASVAGWAEQRL
jgi:alanyl-tRNA synthetase